MNGFKLPFVVFSNVTVLVLVYQLDDADRVAVVNLLELLIRLPERRYILQRLLLLIDLLLGSDFRVQVL